MKYVVVLYCSLLSYSSLAQSTDLFADDPTTKTQKVLTDPKQRAAATSGGDAKKADDYVNKLTGNNPALNDEIYQLAAEILPALVKRANGDVQKMKEMINEYMRNPASLGDLMTSEEKQKVHDLSTKMPQPVNNQ